MIDAFDILENAFGFWIFVFNARFRRHKLKEWRESAKTRWGRVLVAIEIAISTAVGLGVPALVLWWIFG